MNWNNLKHPVTSKKQPETTYNKQESMKWSETTYNEQETTYNNLWTPDSKFMEDLNNSSEGFNITEKP